jgi:cation-transporting ATPase 13A2
MSFVLCSIIIWLLQLYWIYAVCIFVLATGGIALSVYQTRKNNFALASLAHHSSQVCVLRGDNRIMIDSVSLVPGDVVLLETNVNQQIVCDFVLLSGECVVVEASLTGESIPVIKSALPNNTDVFDYDTHSKHILYG